MALSILAFARKTDYTIYMHYAHHSFNSIISYLSVQMLFIQHTPLPEIIRTPTNCLCSLSNILKQDLCYFISSSSFPFTSSSDDDDSSHVLCAYNHWNAIERCTYTHSAWECGKFDGQNRKIEWREIAIFESLYDTRTHIHKCIHYIDIYTNIFACIHKYNQMQLLRMPKSTRSHFHVNIWIKKVFWIILRFFSFLDKMTNPFNWFRKMNWTFFLRS